MIYILTGNGKGKTTCAVGMGIRAVGAGLKVLMIQFLKSGSSSEIKVIKNLKNFDVKSFGQKPFVLPKAQLEKHPKLKQAGVKPISKKDFDLVNSAWELAKKSAKEKKYNIIILDEIFLALYFKLIKKYEVLNFLKRYKNRIDIVLTGRHASKEILKIADLITEFQERTHYYKGIFEGKKAKKGIEF